MISKELKYDKSLAKAVLLCPENSRKNFKQKSLIREEQDYTLTLNRLFRPSKPPKALCNKFSQHFNFQNKTYILFYCQ